MSRFRGVRVPEQIALERAQILLLCDGTLTVNEIAAITGQNRNFVAADICALRRQGHAAPTHIRPPNLDNGGAVYRHFDASGALLYVGCTGNPFLRSSLHAAKSQWFRQVANITIEWFDDGNEAMAAEARAIATEDPVHNVRGKVEAA